MKTIKNKNLKIGLIILIILLLAAALAAIISTQPKANTKKTVVYYGAKKSACEIFNPIDAYYLLGNVYTAKNKNTKNTAPKDIKVTSCVYTQASPVAGTPANSAGLIVRSPISKTGITLNKKVFTSQLPSGAKTISSYGVPSYWDPSTSSLNILKNNTWYTITYSAGKTTSLDQTQKVGTILIKKL